MSNNIDHYWIDALKGSKVAGHRVYGLSELHKIPNVPGSYAWFLKMDRNTRDDISDGDLNVETIGEGNIVKWGKQAKEDLDKLIIKANLKEIAGIDTKMHVSAIINAQIRRYNPEVNKT